MRLARGARLRSFEVLGPLGAGGMGAVYRARDSRLGRDVAIKVLQDRLDGSAEHLLRFKREARAASALNHPNIITIFEIDDVDGAPFIAMELVDGTSLREILQKGRLPIRTLLDLATQVADGLAAAHDRGIVHRDLKPDNIMVSRDGHVKIVDFGIARIERGGDDSSATVTSAGGGNAKVAGTAAYMSPEQASGAADIDFRSDQFSFGTILYELATGQLPFRGATTMETLASIMRDEPEPVERLNPALPPPLRWLIDRCLAKERSHRYDSTRDLARDLRTIRERLPETFPGTRRAPAARLRRALIIGGIVAAVIGSGAAIISWPRASEPPPAAPSLSRKYLAVAPFRDVSGAADAQLFSLGLSEAVRQKLADSGVRVVDPRFSVSAVADGTALHRIAQKLGASLLLSATVERSMRELRVAYSLLETDTGRTLSRRTIAGDVQDIWSIRDGVAAAVAADLGVDAPEPRKTTGLQTAEEQETYVRALGALESARELKSVDAAIAGLHALLETAPASPLVHATLGRAYYVKYGLTYDRQWSEKAARAARRAVSLDPDSSDTLITLGIAESIHGNYDRSIAAFERAMAMQPTSAMAAIGLAQTLAADKHYDDAERMFRRGIALHPTWWFGHSQLAGLYWQQRRYDDALRQYNEVIRLDPSASSGYTGAGAVLLTEGRLKDAAALFRKATSLAKDPAAYLNLGYCYFYLAKYDESVESTRIAVSLLPARSDYWVYLADAYSWSSKYRTHSRGAYETAAERAREELATNPKNHRAHAALALALAKTGDLSQARRSIGRALELAPENPSYLFSAARIANLAGEREESVSWLRQAISRGTSRIEVERHPEFKALRESGALRAVMAPPA